MPNGNEGIFATRKKPNGWLKWVLLAALGPGLGAIGFRVSSRLVAVWDTPVIAAKHIKEDDCRDSLNSEEHKDFRATLKTLKDDNEVIKRWMFVNNEWAWRVANNPNDTNLLRMHRPRDREK